MSALFGTAFGLLVTLIYLGLIIGVAVYLLRLGGRFVRSHERGSAALESIAQKLGSDKS